MDTSDINSKVYKRKAVTKRVPLNDPNSPTRRETVPVQLKVQNMKQWYPLMEKMLKKKEKEQTMNFLIQIVDCSTLWIKLAQYLFIAANDMIQIWDIWEIGKTVYYVDNNDNAIKEEALGEQEVLRFWIIRLTYLY